MIIPGLSHTPSSKPYSVTMAIYTKKHIGYYFNIKGIVFFFFLILAGRGFSQRYNYHTFGTEDGLAQSYVYSVNQDSYGYLWVGTGSGLSRYNGFVFETYSANDSLADNFITCSIRDGKWLWFGHYNGGLSCFDGRKYRNVNVRQGNLSPVTHFSKSPDGAIWVSTFSDGLLKIGNDTCVVKHAIFRDQTIIRSFSFVQDSDLIVGTDTGLLFCRLKGSDEIEIIRHISGIPESKITAVQKRGEKRGFYIATENDGIFQLIYEDNRFKVLKIITDGNSDFKGIQDLFEDSKSNLWLCSFGSGLIKISFSISGEYESVNFFNKVSGYISDNVRAVFEDREGNIWSGNYGQGLTLITPKIFSVFTFDTSKYGNGVYSLYFDKEYKWIGMGNGLIKADQKTNEIIRFYGKSDGLPNDKITSIYSTNGKKLWLGTSENGVFLLDAENEKISKYPFEDGALENSITSITGKGDQVWIGTQKGLWNINSATGRKKRFSINQGGLPHNFISGLYVDNSGRLWVSTPGSVLACIEDQKVSKITLKSFTGNLTLGPITEDWESRIWVGSNGNGVFMIESDSIINLTVKEGLVSNYCYSLICDDRKNIWVGHKDGLSRIETTDFSVKPLHHLDGLEDSYQFNPNAITKDILGKIWFGSDKGLISYDQTMENPELQPPVLGITSVKINDEEVNASDKITLSPGSYKIRIDYLGVCLKEPELVTYQYQLEGYDRGSEITKNTTITYPRLSEGVYKFVLKTSSGDGAVSQNPVTLDIIIKIPLRKKWWFYPGTSLVVILLTIFYLKRREQRLLTEKRILEEKVRERTSEIQSQKNKIESQRDIIKEKNASITSSIKYASHIQNAILPPTDLIDKLFPENFILSKPKDIVSGDFYWMTEKGKKIVITVADCTGHGVPGAFMSLLGITSLNEIVNIEGITKSIDIVKKLRERVIHSLQQGRKDVPITDGMDIALCVFDQERKIVQYTGGMNDLIYIRNGKLSVIKADHSSVCAFIENKGTFTMKEFDYLPGDVFYLFTDGFQDQFGGNYDKKYLSLHFRLTLLEIHKQPMAAQKEILERKLKEWMNDEVQTDDITVIGIRL
jgi:ligand-binding sensor domain-containing protein/serine phosphatase RsbU (regulator of sigma subunit)